LQTTQNAISSFGLTMKPLINNVAYANAGSNLTISTTNEYAPTQLAKVQILKNHHQAAYNKAYQAGVAHVLSSKTYKLGKLVKTLAQPWEWFRNS
jgi:hypothetical protein